MDKPAVPENRTIREGQDDQQTRRRRQLVRNARMIAAANDMGATTAARRWVVYWACLAGLLVGVWSVTNYAIDGWWFGALAAAYLSGICVRRAVVVGWAIIVDDGMYPQGIHLDARNEDEKNGWGRQDWPGTTRDNGGRV